MSRRKLNTTYFFFFIIPYLTAIFMISTAYNVLVNHWDNWWRLGIGGLVGSIFLVCLKVIIQRPLTLLVLHDKKSVVAWLGRFFLITDNKPLLAFNFILDFGLSIAGVFIVHALLPEAIIVQSAMGWPLMIMFISTIIGSYLAYDILSIDPDQ